VATRVVQAGDLERLTQLLRRREADDVVDWVPGLGARSATD
jgi:hypothetical protein